MIEVSGNSLMVMDVGTGQLCPIEGVRFSRAGVLKEHPDLKNNKDWKLIAIQRLKEYMKKIIVEMEKMNYVKDELIKFGYTPLFYTKAGHRPKKFT